MQSLGEKPSKRSKFLRYSIVCGAVLLLLAIVAYQRSSARQQRISAALEDLQEHTDVNVLWRVPARSALYGHFYNLAFGHPPAAYQKYSVAFKPEEVDNAMIDRLIAVEELDSLCLQGRNPTSAFGFPPVPIHQLKLAASREAIDRLLEKYPNLYVYVDPVSEFE